MGRSLRAASGDIVCHALNRANARTTIFHDDGDYAAFERVLMQACERVSMRLLAYCVMPNHWHLVVWPQQDGDPRDRSWMPPALCLEDRYRTGIHDVLSRCGAPGRESVGANQKTLVVIEVHHDICRFSQSSLVVGAQPIQSLECLVLHRNHLAAFIQYAENAQRAILIEEKVSVWAQGSSRLLKSHFGTAELRWSVRVVQQESTPPDVKMASSKAAVSEGCSVPSGYIEGLNDAITTLADFFSILPCPFHGLTE